MPKTNNPLNALVEKMNELGELKPYVSIQRYEYSWSCHIIVKKEKASDWDTKTGYGTGKTMEEAATEAMQQVGWIEQGAEG